MSWFFFLNPFNGTVKLVHIALVPCKYVTVFLNHLRRAEGALLKRSKGTSYQCCVPWNLLSTTGGALSKILKETVLVTTFKGTSYRCCITLNLLSTIEGALLKRCKGIQYRQLVPLNLLSGSIHILAWPALLIFYHVKSIHFKIAATASSVYGVVFNMSAFCIVYFL